MRLLRWPGLGVFAFLLTLSVGGCDEAPTAALLDVSSVGPARIDPGHRLVVEGSGFAVGHEVRVALIGVLTRPFEPAEHIDESFEAEAVNEEHVEMRVTETLLRERFGRATFHGRVEVRFDAQWAGRAGTISGALDEQQIDFVPARAAPTAGVALDEALGLSFADGSEEGIEIADVEASGRGRALGISAGDRLIAIGDANLLPGDAPRAPEAAEQTTLTILREGGTTVLQLDLGAGAREGQLANELIRLGQLALLIAWVALLGAWPLSSIDLAPAGAPLALARPTLAIVARALGGLFLAHAAIFTVDHLPSIGALIASVVGLRAATAMAGSTRPMTQLPAILVSSIALAVALAAIPAVLDVSDVAVLAHSGSLAPLEWPFFREPVGVLSVVLLALAVGIARPTRRLARAMDDLWILAIGALAVVSGTGLRSGDRAGTMAMGVAIVLVAWLLGRAREHVRSTPMTLGLAALLSIVVVVLASAWVIADPTAQLRQALAEVSLAAVGLTVVFALRAGVRERPASRPQHALL